MIPEAHRRKARFLIVGAWNTFFGYGAFIVLYRLAAAVRVHYLFALAASHILATTNAYLSYKHFVFKTKGGTLKEYFRFTMVYWVLFLVNLAALPALVKAAHLGPVPAQGLILAVTVVASYAAHSRFSFAEGPGLHDFTIFGVLAFAAALALPFLGSAFHMDEPFYLAVAKQILRDPWHPTNFLFNASGSAVLVSSGNAQPLLVPYLLAPALRLYAGREWLLRLCMLPFDLMAAAALYLLAARFLKRPLLPVLILWAGPALLLNLRLLTPEKWVAAFGLWGLYALVKGIEEDLPAWFWGSAVLVTLALFSKYSAIFLLVTGTAFALSRGVQLRRVAGWLALAGGPLAAYLAWSAACEPWRWQAIWSHTSTGTLRTPAIWVHNLRALLCFGAGGSLVLALWPHLVSGRSLRRHLLTWGLAALLFIPVLDAGPVLLSDRFIGIFLAAGCLAALFNLWQDRQDRPRGWELWVPWAASVAVLQYFVYWSVVSRFTLFLSIPLTLAAAQALEARYDAVRLHGLHLAALLLTLGLGLSLASVDEHYAEAQRTLARDWATPAVAAGKRVWYTGHWGLQYYMDQAGAACLDQGRGGWDETRPGDLVAVPYVNTAILRPRRPRLSDVASVRTDERLPLRLMCAGQGQASFYASLWGFLPYTVSREPLDEFTLVSLH